MWNACKGRFRRLLSVNRWGIAGMKGRLTGEISSRFKLTGEISSS